MTFVYLASPYSHTDPKIRAQRFLDVHDYAGRLMCYGKIVYCPIISTHEIGRQYSMPYDFQYWQAHNRAFIEPCDELIVALMLGWDESEGVRHEIDLAAELGKRVRYMALMEPQSYMLFGQPPA